jgi:hypothetical protein
MHQAEQRVYFGIKLGDRDDDGGMNAAVAIVIAREPPSAEPGEIVVPEDAVAEYLFGDANRLTEFLAWYQTWLHQHLPISRR